MADSKAVADADQKWKQLQQSSLGGTLFGDEEDDTPSDDIAAQSVTKSKKRSKAILQSLGE